MEAKQCLSSLKSSNTYESVPEPVTTASSVTEPAQQKEIDRLDLKIKGIDSKLSKLVVDIQPLFILKDHVEKVFNSFDSITEKMNSLSRVPDAIKSLQNQFTEMSDCKKSINVATQQSPNPNKTGRSIKKPYDLPFTRPWIWKFLLLNWFDGMQEVYTVLS